MRERVSVEKRVIFYTNNNEYKSIKNPSDTKEGRPNVRIGVPRFGINNTFGVDVMYTTNNNITFGFGAVGGRKNAGVGQNYNTTLNWNQFPEDVYEYRLSQGRYAYFIIGYTLPKFPIYFNLTIGQWDNQIVQNRFDEFRILGNNGYYYLTAPYENKLMVSGLLFYEGFSNKKGSFYFRPYFGYENFSGLSIGLLGIYDFFN